MTLLYTQGFEGFPSTNEDQSDFWMEVNFHDVTATDDAGITAGRAGGLAGWFKSGSISSSGSPRIPMSGYQQGFHGSHDGGDGAAVLTDSTASWTIDALIGRTLSNGTDGSTTTITANTATTITGILAGGTNNDWDADDVYDVHDTWVIGFGYYQDNLSLFGGSNDETVLRAVNPQGENLLSVVLKSGTLHVRSGSGSGDVIAYANVNILARVWYFIEVKVLFHDSAGTVVIRVNEEEVISETAQNTAGAASSYFYPAMIQFGESGGSAAGTDGKCWVDDIYVADDVGSDITDFVGDVRLLVLDPTADGTTEDFTPLGGGDNYIEVVRDADAASDPDAEYVESNTANHVDTYVYGNLPSTPAAIPAVSVKSYVKKSDAGSRTFSHASRSGGSEVYSDPLYPSAGTYRYFQSHFEQDDNGGSPQAWTYAAVNAAEFGIKVES
jgi:hypothetical protein